MQQIFLLQRYLSPVRSPLHFQNSVPGYFPLTEAYCDTPSYFYEMLVKLLRCRGVVHPARVINPKHARPSNCIFYRYIYMTDTCGKSLFMLTLGQVIISKRLQDTALSGKLMKSGKVFTDDVKFYVDSCARAEGVEICMLVCVGDDCHTE